MLNHLQNSIVSWGLSSWSIVKADAFRVLDHVWKVSNEYSIFSFLIVQASTDFKVERKIAFAPVDQLEEDGKDVF
jgi:hypothetical protein